MNWIKYEEEKPKVGELVLCYRDIESNQIFVTQWTEEEEYYADMNEITYWAHINYPISLTQ